MKQQKGILLRLWSRNEQGSTAVEFALIAIPFIQILIGIIELSLMMVTGALLESATGAASRQIRTGEMQRLGLSTDAQQQMFIDTLCLNGRPLLDCAGVQVEVQKLDNYDDFANHGASFNNEGDFQSSGFETGNFSDVVLIRTFYRYEFITPLIGDLLGGERDFISTIVLQVEPYEFQNN